MSCSSIRASDSGCNPSRSGREIVDDSWQRLDADTGVDQVPDSGAVIVPLTLWQAHRDALIARQDPVGVWLEAGEEPSALADDLGQLPLIAINFPVYRDGRGYSYARELRTRFGYQGEIRAIGDVLQDQLEYMWRCGFDAFAVREDKDIEEALAGLKGFSVHYQGDARNPLPIYARNN